MPQGYVDLRQSNAFVRKVFLYMILAIIVSVGTPFALGVAAPGLLQAALQHYNVLLIAELLMVFSLSWKVYQMPVGMVRGIFFLYSALNGLTLMGIGLIYDLQSVLYCFMITFVIFLVASIYGMKTQEDLASYGRFLRIGLFALIGVSLINLWIAAPAMYWAISIGGTVLFTGLIAYDTNRIRNISFAIAEQSGESIEKFAVMGALSLYLDFVNLFIYVLRIFGRKR